MKTLLSTITLSTVLFIIGCGGGSSNDKIEQLRDQQLDTKISGIIFEDTNKNGIHDKDENGTDGIKLTITDANDDEYILSTDINGKYHISNIMHGKATLIIDTETLPKDGNISAQIDSNKIDFIYDVKPYKNNLIPAIPYILPEIQDEYNITDENDTVTTIKVGEVHGRVFLDFDASYDYSITDGGIEGVNVVIKDNQGKTYTVKTDINGIYSIKNIPEGNVTVFVDDNKTIAIFQESVKQITEIDGIRKGRSTQNQIKDKNVTVTVISGEKNKAEGIGYFATSKSLGVVSGTIFFDTNGNGKYDPTDERLVGITVNVKDSDEHIYTTESRDERGHIAYKGTYQVAVPPGEVTITIDIKDDNLPPYTKTIGKEVDKEIAEIGEKTFAGGFGFTQ